MRGVLLSAMSLKMNIGERWAISVRNGTLGNLKSIENGSRLKRMHKGIDN